MSKKIASIRDVRPQSRNANRHSPRGMGALERSIQEDGWIGAITVAADGETFDGSARIETAGATGFDEVEPIIIRSRGDRPIIHVREDIPSATDERAVRLGIAANRVAELNLDWNAQELAALAQETDLSQLFNPDEMAALLAQVEGETASSADDDAAPAINPDQPTRCQPGDVWRVGPHLIACLDSTEPGNLDRVVRQRPRMIVADPPYGADFDPTKERGGPFGGVGKGGKVIPSVPRPAVLGDKDATTARNASALCLAQYPDATQIWWGANYYADALSPSSCWIVWDKENTGDFADVELAWTNQGTAARLFRHMWNGMLKDSERGERRVHGTQKPIALFEWLYVRYGASGDIILDPFLGSGPSLKAAHRMGDRVVVGFELSPHYCDHILEWAEAGNLTCERVSD